MTWRAESLSIVPEKFLGVPQITAAENLPTTNIAQKCEMRLHGRSSSRNGRDRKRVAL